MFNSDRYFRLLLANSKKGGGLKAEADADGDEATLYLYDVIASGKMEAEWFGGVAPETFVKELNAIDAKTIHLRINSPGGSVFGARAMESAIRAHKATIVAHVDGYAASAASFLAVSCDEVQMLQGAFMMIHKSWSCMCGNSDDFLSAADLLDKIDGTLAETYAAKCGLSINEIMDMLEAETWLTGQEAVDIGLADRIMDEEANAEAWDLSAYEKAPPDEVQVLLHRGEKVDPKGDDLDDAAAKHDAGQDKHEKDSRERYERFSRLHKITQPESRAA